MIDAEALRYVWFEMCAFMPPWPTYNFQPWGDSMQTETQYRGYRIVAQKYTGACDRSCFLGFECERVFVVLDEFDDNALPFNHHQFWTPWDAKMAIDFFEWLKTTIDLKKWPTTPAYEFNRVMAMHVRTPEVFMAVQRIRQALRESADFDENPTRAVADILAALEQSMHESPTLYKEVKKP